MNKLCCHQDFNVERRQRRRWWIGYQKKALKNGDDAFRHPKPPRYSRYVLTGVGVAIRRTDAGAAVETHHDSVAGVAGRDGRVLAAVSGEPRGARACEAAGGQAQEVVGAGAAVKTGLVSARILFFAGQARITSRTDAGKGVGSQALETKDSKRSSSHVLICHVS